nr:hypothetical protein [Tanacetum cinerariifolium]
MAIAQGEQSSKQAPTTAEQVPYVLTALVVHLLEEKGLKEKPTEDEPSFKKLRFLVPNPNIPSPTPLKSIMPQGIRPPVVINMPLDHITDNLFNITSSEFSPSPLKDDKGSPIHLFGGSWMIKEHKMIHGLFLERRGSWMIKEHKMVHGLFLERSLSGKKMTLEEAKAQMEQIKKLKFLKAEKENFEKRLKVLTPKELEAQEAELAAYEAKREKILKEYNHYITFRADPMPITKINYKVEIHELASKVRINSNDMLLKNLKEKYQCVKTQAIKLGIPPLPQLTAFKLLPTERKICMKRKRMIELIHETFIKENIVVDGMQRNLTLPEGVVGKAGMVVKELEAGISLYNGNFNMKEYVDGLGRVKGGNTLMIILPFEEEQAELSFSE